MRITTSKIVVTVVENNNDSSVEWSITVGTDGVQSVKRSLFVDGEHQTTENNPSDMPKEVRKEVRRSVSRLARAQGEINRI